MPDRRRLVTRLQPLAELLGLTGLAVTQPLLDVLGKAPDVFLFHDAGRGDIIGFALLVAVVPALTLFLVEALVGLVSSRARRVVHLAFLGGLVALLVLQLAKQADVTTGALAVAAAVAGAVLAVLAYRKWQMTRLLLGYLSLGSVLFVAAFLITSPVSDLLGGQDVAAADVAPATDPHSVVFLQLDELPLDILVDEEGAIDADLYPNLAELAHGGTWYRNATTVATFTSYAVPAILTGRYPDDDRVAIASAYPENLFTLLANQFDLDVLETVTALCPPNLCDDQLIDRPVPQGTTAEVAPPPSPPRRDPLWALLDDAVDTYQALTSPDPDAGEAIDTVREETSVEVAPTSVPPTTRPPQGPGAEDAAADAAAADDEPGFYIAGLARIPALEIDAVTDLTHSIERGEDPTLHYLHLLLPHSPYRFLPSGQSYDPEVSITDDLSAISGTRSHEQRAVDGDRQRLVLQAMYTDRIVGQVLTRLRRTGMADDTVVVVVADHGINLQPDGTPRPASTEALTEVSYPDLLPVPLLIRGPGIEAGAVRDDNIQTIDVLPTLAGLLGIDLPWPVDGIPLGTEQRSSDTKQFHLVSFSVGGAGPTGVGPAIRFDGAQVLADALDRNVDTWLRDDNPDYRPYDLDEAGELVGSEVDDHPSSSPSGLTLTIDDPTALDDVDPSTGVLRTHVTGRLDGLPDRDQATLALTLNGRIAAVVTTWSEDAEPHRLDTMLVPDFLRAGANEVRAYRVTGPEGARRLAEVAIEN